MQQLKIWMSLILLLAGCLTATLHAQTQTTPNRMSSKNLPHMAWAHYVGWGFNFDKVFDEPNRFISTYDRTTLGQWVGTDTGSYSNTRKQILSAMQYGLDGFCVDLTSTKVYAGSMGRIYQAAEGLPFQVALCVDGWHESEDQIINDMTDFLTRWGNHPNNAYVDGRPVIFMYKIRKTPAQAKTILDALAAKGLKAYWLLQPQRETNKWDDIDRNTEYMQVFDGLYDFGINGYSQQDNNTRLLNGRKALEKAGKPNGLLCAGITQGYVGPHNGFYRPYFGSGSFQTNWNAALEAKAQWVCLTTWNDYWETTHFEPSVWGSDVLLRLNQEKIRVWKDQPLIARPPQVFVSYQQECRLGDEWDLELASLPYTTTSATVTLRLTDLQGKTIHESEPLPLPGDKELIHRFHFTDLGLKTPQRLRIFVKVQQADDDAKDEDNWVRLYPLTVRPGTMLSMRTIRFNLNGMSDSYASVQLTPTADKQSQQLTASFKAWAWTGKADLYQNAQFIASVPIAKFGGMQTSVQFDLANITPQYPRDMYLVKFTRDDGQILWSNPLLVEAPGVDFKQQVAYPVLERHMTFDKAWMGIVTGYKVQHAPYSMVKKTLPLAEVFDINLPMDHRSEDDQLADIGGWHWPVLMGASHRFGKVDPNAVPQWVQQAGPDGSTRQMLQFDGENDRIALKARSMPHDMATVEAWIKPADLGKAMSIFSDQNGGMHLGIDVKGKPFVSSHGKDIVASSAISADQWTHLAGSYDSQFVRLWVNGKVVAQIANPNQSRGLNSMGIIGGLIREGHNIENPFNGLMAGFALRALPAQNYGFQLIDNRESSIKP